jgi:hypothetical protein
MMHFSTICDPAQLAFQAMPTCNQDRNPKYRNRRVLGLVRRNGHSYNLPAYGMLSDVITRYKTRLTPHPC